MELTEIARWVVILAAVIFVLNWFTVLIATSRLRVLNSLTLRLLKRMQAAHSDQLFSTDALTNIERNLSGKLTLLGSLLNPWRSLRKAIVAARELAPLLISSQRRCNKEDTTLIQQIQTKQRNLLCRRLSEELPCTHDPDDRRMRGLRQYNRFIGQDFKNNRTESEYLVEATSISGAELRRSFWCKYCLRSWGYVEQLPVIVRPPM